jgi:hypothetical protein
MFFLEAQKSVDASDESEDIRNGSLAFSWARARGHTRSCMHKTLADLLVPTRMALRWIPAMQAAIITCVLRLNPPLSLSVSHATHAQGKL